MSPLAALIVRELVAQLPLLAIDILRIVSKESFTDADWAEVMKSSRKTFEELEAEAEKTRLQLPR